MRNKQEFVGFRASKAERTKLEGLSQSTGLAMSEVLRSLVNSAELAPIQKLHPVVNVKVFTKTEGIASTLTEQRNAFAV